MQISIILFAIVDTDTRPLAESFGIPVVPEGFCFGKVQFRLVLFDHVDGAETLVPLAVIGLLEVNAKSTNVLDTTQVRLDRDAAEMFTRCLHGEIPVPEPRPMRSQLLAEVDRGRGPAPDREPSRLFPSMTSM